MSGAATEPAGHDPSGAPDPPAADRAPVLDVVANAVPPGDAVPGWAAASPARRVATLARLTVVAAWRQDPFAKAAQSAFWQTLSLPPLLLGLLGCVGYLGDWVGAPLVQRLRDEILTFADTVFTHQVVVDIIRPTVADTLSQGKAEVASLGFVLSLWAGSSAVSCYVDAITAAYGQKAVRHEVWQRLFALLLYLAGLVVAVVTLPLLALGPDVLPRLVPAAHRAAAEQVVGASYYPVVGLLLLLTLTTLYKLAPPHKLPWHRGLPGAVAAMVLFLVASVGLRGYIGWIGSTGYTYGALATPIAFLLFAFFAGLATVLGAHLNATVQRLWPAKAVRRWRRLLRAARGL
ncbi:MAG TPA: YihY/virulence factor BrkB family protein [Actinocatenispora sp.]